MGRENFPVSVRTSGEARRGPRLRREVERMPKMNLKGIGENSIPVERRLSRVLRRDGPKAGTPAESKDEGGRMRAEKAEVGGES